MRNICEFLREIRRRVIAEVKGAVEHQEAITNCLRRLSLPWGWTSADRDEAAELAERALSQLPIGASDIQMGYAINHVIAPVATLVAVCISGWSQAA